MKTLLRVLAVAMAAFFTVDAASAATANTLATVKVSIERRSEQVAFEAERMTRYMGTTLDLTARQESKLYYMNLEWAERCARYTGHIGLDLIVDRWYYEYTRDLDVILNNRQMRLWRRAYGHRVGDYERPRASVSIHIGTRPHVHIGGGHNNPHKDPHTKPHVAPHKDPHTKPHVAPHKDPHTKPHNGHFEANKPNGNNRPQARPDNGANNRPQMNGRPSGSPSQNKGNVGNGTNRPSNNKGNVGSSNSRPSNNKGSYRSSSSSNRNSKSATRSSSSNSNDRGNGNRGGGTSSRGR